MKIIEIMHEGVSRGGSNLRRWGEEYWGSKKKVSVTRTDFSKTREWFEVNLEVCPNRGGERHHAVGREGAGEWGGAQLGGLKKNSSSDGPDQRSKRAAPTQKRIEGNVKQQGNIE